PHTLLPRPLLFYSPRPPPVLHSFPTRRSSDLWERPGLGFWVRLWQTSTLATLHARTFFGALPDGDASTALAFALVCETIAVSGLDRKSTRLNSSHLGISYAVFCLKKKKLLQCI